MLLSVKEDKRFWYRYEGYNPICVDLEVIKETKKGVWLDNYGKKRFVLKTGLKRYACPTIEEAKVSFYRRKVKQISILKTQIEGAERALETIKKHLTEEQMKIPASSYSYWD